MDNTRWVDEYDYPLPMFEHRVLEMINEVRQDAGLPLVSGNPGTSLAACSWSAGGTQTQSCSPRRLPSRPPPPGHSSGPQWPERQSKRR